MSELFDHMLFLFQTVCLFAFSFVLLPQTVGRGGWLGRGVHCCFTERHQSSPRAVCPRHHTAILSDFQSGAKNTISNFLFHKKYKLRETKYHLRWWLHRNTVLLFHWTTVPDKTQDLLEQKRNWKYLWRIIRKAPKKVWFGAQSQCLSSLHLTTKIHLWPSKKSGQIFTAERYSPLKKYSPCSSLEFQYNLWKKCPHYPWHFETMFSSRHLPLACKNYTANAVVTLGDPSVRVSIGE